jgi:hypothetical protein
MPRAPAPIRICGHCGTIAPLQRSSCSICQTAFPPQPYGAAGGEGGAVWARVHEADFMCRGCGLRSPTTLSFGEEAECLRCGLHQAFPAGQWEKALARAHGVADLAGPDPEGRFPHPHAPVGARNPHRSVGVEHTYVEHTEQSTIIDGGGVRQLSLRIQASPGHPLCERCQAPLTTQFDGRGHAQTTCPRCGDRAVYALPEGSSAMPALRAVVGPEFRTDRAAVRLGAVDASGVAAMSCPSCGAGLSVRPGEEMATCQFCKTTSRIARRAWAKAGAAPPFEPFWALFEGPSARRAAVAAGKTGDDEEEDDDDDDDDEVAIPSFTAHPVAMPPPARAGMMLGIVMAAVIMALVGGIVAFQLVMDTPARPPTRGRVTPRR